MVYHPRSDCDRIAVRSHPSRLIVENRGNRRAAMKIEVTCPNGHVMEQHDQGSLSFSVEGRSHLKIRVYCPVCALLWEMSSELSSCESEKLVRE
jgi:hypothetical protein